ncbi:MAG: SDR family oxidoreductase [Rhodoferax sp.]|uniref:SDR family NAD(P)-dependent oxidoreductase n=1 Tax=Rhodoferax sp. TaxID=50421 RepID=UPI002730A07A|nr:SDR family oxidoreductase [Rhodoferax sp.]MDP1527832.1 SDR family oxidoreductase [Rhodoferax sp.]MDP1938581.1 SDR family oxidoreductase [Hylemonella sp.]
MQAKRVCLITGAATGIGAACAREFAAHGWQLGLSYLDDTTHVHVLDVAASCEALGASTLVQRLDVTSEASCQAFSQAALQRFGRIDALVNCAGTTRFIAHTDLDALTPEEFHRTYDVNTVGLYRMTRACVPALKASGHGSVVNISSIGGAIGRGSSMAYAASKGAVNTLTLALARALAPQIRVNAIAPGFVEGGLPSRVLDAVRHAEVVQTQTAASVLQRVSQPEEVAALACFLTERAPGMTGEIIQMDNGLHLNAG